MMKLTLAIISAVLTTNVAAFSGKSPKTKEVKYVSNGHYQSLLSSPQKPDNKNINELKHCQQIHYTDKFAVNTDGQTNSRGRLVSDGSRSAQKSQSYQYQWTQDETTKQRVGTKKPVRPLPSLLMGATLVRRPSRSEEISGQALTAGDIICYSTSLSPQKQCGVVFDNGWTNSTKRGSRVTKGRNKPPEATKKVHQALGANSANGRKSDLSGKGVQESPLKLRLEDRNYLKSLVVKAALSRNPRDYSFVNSEIQRIASNYSCMKMRKGKKSKKENFLVEGYNKNHDNKDH